MFKPRGLPFDPRANKIASLQSLKFHHGGLCEDYVSALNRDIADTPIQNADLFTIITQSFKATRDEECEFSQISKLYKICLGFSRIFNNASEIYNHDFYFDCIAQPSEPSGELADALAQAFGGMENFKSEFLKRALGLFGSGWCWLACDERGANLEIIATQNADTPITRGKIPLLACDLCEHAYYADHQNARKSYVESFLRFADFGFASDAYCWAKKQGLGSVRLYISELHPSASSRCDCDCCG